LKLEICKNNLFLLKNTNLYAKTDGTGDYSPVPKVDDLGKPHQAAKGF